MMRCGTRGATSWNGSGKLDDQASWRTFLDSYGGLRYCVARAAGLTDSEAQEAVQETVISVSRSIGGLHYDPAVGSFKDWLLQTARWRIADQLQRRERHGRLAGGEDADGPRTALIERFADPAGFDLATVWDDGSRASLLTAALGRVRRQVDPQAVADFRLLHDQRAGWPPACRAGTRGEHRAGLPGQTPRRRVAQEDGG